MLVPDVIVCVLWGEQALPCVPRKCHFCNKTVALSARNVEKVKELGLTAACLECVTVKAKEFQETTDEPVTLAAMVGGEVTGDFGEATDKAMTEYRRHRIEEAKKNYGH